MSVLTNIQVFGLEDSVRASKYPMATDVAKCTADVTATANKLAACESNSGEDNFLSGIIVQFDLTFTVKAWTEAERYHFFQIVSSQSTMHRITRFDIDKTYIDYVDERSIEVMRDLIAKYNADNSAINYLRVLYSNPCGCKLTARISTNYRQLKTIYRQRRAHRLPEWREFCEQLKALPYSEWITGADA